MDQSLTTPWTTGQKVAFRFAFIFFGLTTIMNWNLTLFFAGLAISKKSFSITGVFEWMIGPFSWLDRHFLPETPCRRLRQIRFAGSVS